MQIFATGQQYAMTPAHAYNGTIDFASILEDMKKGEFPVGTGQPFPVNFDDEEDQLPQNAASPWVQNRTHPMPGAPPPPIYGPRAFGLK